MATDEKKSLIKALVPESIVSVFQKALERQGVELPTHQVEQLIEDVSCSGVKLELTEPFSKIEKYLFSVPKKIS